METQKTVMNAMAVLKKPIFIEENHENLMTIYGIMYNKYVEAKNTKEGNPISGYLDYLGGMSNLLKVAEFSETDDKEFYVIPKYGLTISTPKHECAKVITIVAKGLVEYETYDFEESIEWNDGEVDSEDQHLIISPSLIERYTK
ncbi:MAG: hypothetical protein J1E16_00640 [Muribaculaceae bacterium]|nr:hypothetical protein [Muribaculaceae bacterium]